MQLLNHFNLGFSGFFMSICVKVLLNTLNNLELSFIFCIFVQDLKLEVMKWLIFKYKCGTTVTQQWDDIYDGKWPYGDLDEKVFIKDYNLIYDDDI